MPTPLNPSDAATGPSSDRRRRRRRTFLYAAALSVVAGAWIFREPLRGRITQDALLASAAPAREELEEAINQSRDPASALLAAWRTGRIVQREVAMALLTRALTPNQPLAPALDAMLIEGALDPDMNVRELALGGLAALRHPRWPALAAAQLRDCDPQVRLLGLNQLKRAPAAEGVPVAARALDDGDPQVLATAVNLLAHWSGQDFGVKLVDAVPEEDPKTGLSTYRADAESKARAGAALAKQWWTRRSAEFTNPTTDSPAQPARAQPIPPIADFTLPALAGGSIRLSTLRGKVVLINFWTTWCPACVGEMPVLVELQKRHGDQVAILGVSLDALPDEDGHAGGHENSANADAGHVESATAHPSPTADALRQIRQKVARVAAARGLNYAILLDEQGGIGGRFNGGELPTTVIVDREGHLRRRFVGPRSLPVFEAMVAEAAQRLPNLSP